MVKLRIYSLVALNVDPYVIPLLGVLTMSHGTG